MARTENSVTFLRSEYKETAFLIKAVELDIGCLLDTSDAADDYSLV
jgi:hypothetical protein